ncbi:MAG TPA: PAS and helix-turn-helix domain-containing protein [Nitrospira sp.]|nr:PAS and helix-turn-helix domain-containing protein [Nitrospira sp.]
MKQVSVMLQRTTDGAMLMNGDGNVILWNKAAERLLGFFASEVIGRPCEEVMRGETLAGHPFCSSSCAVGHRLGCGSGVRNFDIQTRTKNGKVIWLNVSSLPVPSRKPGRFLVAHLFRDISARQKVLGLAEELYAVLAPTSGRNRPISETPRRAPDERPDTMPTVPALLPLSEREREILRWLAAGKNGKEIAEALCISPVTVRNHIQHILEKLGAHSRLQALAIAFPPGGVSART